MEKEVEVLSSDGKRIENGKIVVSINYTEKPHKIAAPSGEGDVGEEMKKYSKVEAFREGEDTPIHSVETLGTNHLINHVKSMEDKLRKSLKLKVEEHEQLTIEDELELMGYN